jgi:hypothetical protein
MQIVAGLLVPIRRRADDCLAMDLDLAGCADLRYALMETFCRAGKSGV